MSGRMDVREREKGKKIWRIIFLRLHKKGKEKYLCDGR